MLPDGLRFETNQGFQAIDLSQFALHALHGYGWRSGGEPTVGGDSRLAFAPMTVVIDGEEKQLGSSSISLDEYYVGEAYDYDNPFMVLVGVTTNASGDPILQAYPGDPAPYDPDIEDKTVRGDPFKTNDPSPPDLSDPGADDYDHRDPPVVLACVNIGEDQTRIDPTTDLQDRRVSIDFLVATLDAADLTVTDTLSLGDQTLNTDDTIATLGDIFSEGDIEAIASALDITSHDDLTGVTGSDHHERYDDSEARDAVRGNVDADELDRDNALVGQVLTDDGWQNPIQPQATVLASSDQEGYSSLTLPGDASGTVTATIEGALTGRIGNLLFAPGVDPSSDLDGDAPWDATLAGRDPVPSRNETDLTIDLEWTDTPPGAGNDLTVSWTLFDGLPASVDGRITVPDIIDAIDGNVITPAALEPQQGSVLSEYDNLADVPDRYLDRPVTVYITGKGDDGEGAGQYLRIGGETGQWVGPYGEGITLLSQLGIDTDKDWRTNRIRNLGAPQSDRDAARLAEVRSLSDFLEAHQQASQPHQQAIERDTRERGIRRVTLAQRAYVPRGQATPVATARDVSPGDAIAIYELSIRTGNGQANPEDLDVRWVAWDGNGGYDPRDTIGKNNPTYVLPGTGRIDAGNSHLNTRDPDMSVSQTVHYRNETNTTEEIALVVDNGEIGPGTDTDQAVVLEGYIEHVPASEVD